MSDTSVVSGGGSTEYVLDNAVQPKRPGCWTQIGANVCVGVLALVTIVLATIIIVTFYKIHQVDKLMSRRGANGKKGCGDSILKSIFDFGKKNKIKLSNGDAADANSDGSDGETAEETPDEGGDKETIVLEQ